MGPGRCTNRQIRYTSLGPGTYTFTVKAANADGYWNEDWGFHPHKDTAALVENLVGLYLVCPSVIIGALFGFIAYRSAALKKENKLLESKVVLRTNQLQSSLENLKSTQSQLIQSEKMASLGELTAGIAHEIQNPLNFVNNFSELNTELVDDLEQEIDQGRLEEAKGDCQGHKGK
jgi:signal transduction histidine kinase